MDVERRHGMIASLFPISLCRCDSYYGKLLFSFGGYSLALYTVHNTVIHLVCKNKLCMWELSILDMVTLRDFSDLNFKICRILPCSIYQGGSHLSSSFPLFSTSANLSIPFWILKLLAGKFKPVIKKAMVELDGKKYFYACLSFCLHLY